MVLWGSNASPYTRFARDLIKIHLRDWACVLTLEVFAGPETLSGMRGGAPHRNGANCSTIETGPETWEQIVNGM